MGLGIFIFARSFSVLRLQPDLRGTHSLGGMIFAKPALNKLQNNYHLLKLKYRIIQDTKPTKYTLPLGFNLPIELNNDIHTLHTHKHDTTHTHGHYYTYVKHPYTPTNTHTHIHTKTTPANTQNKISPTCVRLKIQFSVDIC